MPFFKTQKEFNRTFGKNFNLPKRKSTMAESKRIIRDANRLAKKASYKATMHRILGGAASKFQSIFK